MTTVLSLMGSIRVRGPDGDDLTPRSQKARGALALLGTAPDLRLNRARLQDLLWSDRSKQQGSDSLRQMLRELRTSLGEMRDIVLTGVGWVGLDPEQVRIDLTPVYDAGGTPIEFAADIDIPDPEFESWLRDMRLRLTPDNYGPTALELSPPPEPVPARPAPQSIRQALFGDAPTLPSASAQPHYIVALDPVETNEPRAHVIGEMVINEAASRACEMIPAMLADEIEIAGPATGTRIGAMCYSTGEDCSLMVVMRDIASGARGWTRRFTIRATDETATMRHAIAQITVALLDRARRTSSPNWTTFPIWDVFSYSRDRLEAADEVLASLPPGQENAVSLALRSYLRNTLIIERLTEDPVACSDEAESFARQARELAPNNPVVLAVASLSASWRRDAIGALEIANAACRADPDNEMACHALSQALTDVGRDLEALEAADRGARGALAELGPACWLMRRSVVQIRLGRFGDAENSAAAAYAFAADNRPSLRFLAALRYRRGDEVGAADALRRLRLIEPDFSLELMAAPEYPVSTLRMANLMGITRSGL
ncbi:SARP family transcriptional regulator [Paracoccus sp. MBLB3053]|uniref:SARP family transcriptional regulator n=1 Tax=Paracoccus aurantius TaxID=3073814 RepID=A0ABU2HSL8_9RHOB|nr:SARP family transcriptional regulator [Paracoccus sp. MBLB3053]MDS9468042.1 SARP family transcriptional regulator [Paracoccus sp. MBLB3053]